MSFALAILALTVFALSLLADYKWRQWMNKRRAEHQTAQDSRSDPRRQSP